jgi:hypothetical protein
VTSGEAALHGASQGERRIAPTRSVGPGALRKGAHRSRIAPLEDPGTDPEYPSPRRGARLASKHARGRKRAIQMSEGHWHKDAIFYEVYVRGLFDANGRWDLEGLISKYP